MSKTVTLKTRSTGHIDQAEVRVNDAYTLGAADGEKAIELEPGLHRIRLKIQGQPGSTCTLSFGGLAEPNLVARAADGGDIALRTLEIP